MSSRSDIIGADEWQVTTRSGLVYSEVLGWIDLGHARGEDISCFWLISAAAKPVADLITRLHTIRE